MKEPLIDNTIQKRDLLFDNLKGILILLVVIGHTFEKYIGDGVLPYSIYGTLYTFHMPLFIFISGYFSKNADKARSNAFNSLLLPYLIFNTLYFLTQSILHHKLEFSILEPGWTLWYLLSLFTMKLVLKDVARIKLNIAAMVLIALVIGLLPEFNHTFSLSRTICFMPFFLMGYYANESTINKIRSYKIPLATIASILIVVIFIFWTRMFQLSSPVKLVKMLYMSGPYSIRDISNIGGILMRGAEYIIAVILGLALIATAPSHKINWLGQMGVNTLAIYIGHTYLISILYKLVPHWDSSLAGNLALFICPLFITLFLSLNFFSRWTDQFLGFTAKVLFKKESV